jgi:hypothetical protein
MGMMYFIPDGTDANLSRQLVYLKADLELDSPLTAKGFYLAVPPEDADRNVLLANGTTITMQEMFDAANVWTKLKAGTVVTVAGPFSGKVDFI